MKLPLKHLKTEGACVTPNGASLKMTVKVFYLK